VLLDKVLLTIDLMSKEMVARQEAEDNASVSQTVT
jgi:hypothetical protein